MSVMMVGMRVMVVMGRLRWWRWRRGRSSRPERHRSEALQIILLLALVEAPERQDALREDARSRFPSDRLVLLRWFFHETGASAEIKER